MSAEESPSPFEKSMTFLRDICKMENFCWVDTGSEEEIKVRIKGISGRHYEVKGKQQHPHPALSGNSKRIGTWSTSVVGAAWKKDIESNDSRFTVSLCLNINQQKVHLPIGDKLASLALSLRNDIELAMEIPLVAQFIVCPRNKFEHIFTFQDEMIVTQDMIDMGEDEQEFHGFEDDEEEMDWEVLESYYSEMDIIELEEQNDFSTLNQSQECELDEPDSPSFEEMVDRMMRVIDRQEDKQSRGSS